MKTIVVLILLSALAFVVGSLSSDGLKSAMAPVGLLVLGVSLMCLGRYSWALVFILPSAVSALDISFLKELPIAYITSGGLLVYWLIMYIMGYVKITWHKSTVIDIATLIFSLYFAFTWVMHPVTISAFVNEITDVGYASIGGKDYIWFVFASLTYIFISIIPMEMDRMGKLLKVCFWITVFCLLITTAKGVLLAAKKQADVLVEGEGARDSGFVALGTAIFTYVVCKYDIVRILCSPWKIILIVASTFGVAVSGYRNLILQFAVVGLFSQFLKRRLLLTLLPCAVFYVALLVLSHGGVLNNIPYGVQRVISSVPGAEVSNRRAAQEAKASLEWRYQMWEWAMDPSSGYIKDYTWGDGFGQSAYWYRLYRINLNRGKVRYGDQEIFAKQGQWHSGPITAIHRTGYVGLCLVSMWFLVVVFYTVRVCLFVRHIKYSEYFLYYLMSTLLIIFQFYASAGTFIHIFGGYFYLALVKMVFSLGIKCGHIKPLFNKQNYVPLMVKAIEDVQHGPAKPGEQVAKV